MRGEQEQDEHGGWVDHTGRIGKGQEEEVVVLVVVEEPYHSILLHIAASSAFERYSTANCRQAM